MPFSSRVRAATLGTLVLGLATILLADEPKKDVAHVFINGGASIYSNYSWHARDLESFYRGLFDEQALVLNAGGPDSPVVLADDDGMLLREDNGELKLGIDNGKYITKPATLDNTIELFDQIRAQNPTGVTAVYGDHGTRKGVSLWNEDVSLGPKKLMETYSKFPDSIFLRSIFLGCDAGSAIVDPDRKTATSPQGLAEYLGQAYKKNICGLALSDEAELGQYYSYTRWPENPWKPIFADKKTLTLSKLKNAFATDDGFRASPMLTSDYLLRDLAAYFCQKTVKKSDQELLDAIDNLLGKRSGQKEGAGTHAAEKTPSGAAASLTPPSSDILKQLCGSTEAKELAERKKNLSISYQISDTISALKQYWLNQYQAGHDESDVLKNYVKAQTEIDQIEGQIAGEGEEASKTTKTARIKELREKFVIPFMNERERIVGTKEFKKYFAENTTATWIEKNRDKFPDFYQYSYVFHHGIPLDTQTAILETSQVSFQGEVKATQLKYNAMSRKLLEDWIGKEAPEYVRTLFKGITDCENSLLI